MIVVHRRERRSKCSVEPLRGREGFVFLDFPLAEPPSLPGYVRLSPGAEPLSAADRDRGLLLLDGTWKHAAPMERAFADVPARSLVGWKTAYPRVSKLYAEPEWGLATIEAVFAACTILRRPTDGLLDDYRWAEQFVKLNDSRSL